MKMTMTESAARHMAAGVMDLDELGRLVEQDTGRALGRKTLISYRSRFRRHGVGWLEAERERNRDAGRRQYAENPDKKREASRRWRAEHPARQLLRQCRQSAKARGLECAITAEMIEAMLAPMTCSATGLPLSLEHDASSSRNPWAPSVDRIDCAIGYRPGNIRIVCWAFNQMRGDFPDEVVRTLAEAAHRALNGAP